VQLGNCLILRVFGKPPWVEVAAVLAVQLPLLQPGEAQRLQREHEEALLRPVRN
jgi:hypothetical protein